ncbi:thiosulfate oxidation carrier protein SoxY [Hydrogenovibrio sp. JE_KL2]|jgi:sulfur-oxidizing protein SoxY|uniref:thiosulfate oxidation carrier protein SoxY n=1 Tax=Hydrogenovibrio sp. JE_KL2 TaxID=2651188 RepID=UPI00128D6A37|nr:thiosulfate oxidation carrier protein SoxY [Hydrogenovibrio sp. JE_KL2]MBN2607221.1 thiosulfate oxidation carrier protein SoxY [Thiotrichales bacterium]MPQ75605.1 thiosulfate oxidation carrier protein SoxY [Hydrogenovibrio sp. JE_KL2]
MKRRSFLKGTLATGAAAVAVNAGLLTPSTVLADWNKKAFDAKKVDDALNGMYGTASATASGDITLKAPAIAENGAVTPITIDASKMKGVESISIVASKNPMPLVCEYSFASAAEGYVSTRIKMGETQNVVAIVKAGGKLYKAEQEVKVTIGGCGG